MADSTVDWSSPLSCDGLDGCTVSGVQLAPSDGAHLFGIASSTDGTKRVVWERTLDVKGATLETNLLSYVVTGSASSAVPDTVLVEEVQDVGLVLGLSGLTPSSTPVRVIWQAIADPEASPYGGAAFPTATHRLMSVVMTKDSGTWVDGTTDAHGNFLWGSVIGGWGSGGSSIDLGPGGVVLSADSQHGEAHWYGTRADPPTTTSAPPPSDYVRSSDFVTITGASWNIDLDVHSIVRMRAGTDGATLVAGRLRSGPLDVRRIGRDGATSWAVSPMVDTPDSLCIAPDNAGGAVVAWNMTPADGSGPRIVLQHFASDGGSCTERRFPGIATDVLVRADDRIVLATDGAVLQIAP